MKTFATTIDFVLKNLPQSGLLLLLILCLTRMMVTSFKWERFGLDDLAHRRFTLCMIRTFAEASSVSLIAWFLAIKCGNGVGIFFSLLEGLQNVTRREAIEAVGLLLAVGCGLYAAALVWELLFYSVARHLKELKRDTEFLLIVTPATWALNTVWTALRCVSDLALIAFWLAGAPKLLDLCKAAWNRVCHFRIGWLG